jgi:hypothetical protein
MTIIAMIVLRITADLRTYLDRARVKSADPLLHIRPAEPPMATNCPEGRQPIMIRPTRHSLRMHPQQPRDTARREQIVISRWRFNALNAHALA